MKSKKLKRILAWIGIVILLGLYLTTMILAIIGDERTQGLFLASLVCTILVPVMMYAMLLTARILGGKDHSDPTDGSDQKH